MRKYLFFVYILSLFLIFNPGSISAAGNQIVMTWHANSYYPANFIGKPLAVNGSRIDISIELLSENKFTDISNEKIAWYIDGAFYTGGVGLKNIFFNVAGVRGGSHLIRVEIGSGDNIFQKTINIPVSGPEIVFESVAFDDVLKKESSVVLNLLPYFFNINSLSDLDFEWKINGLNTDEAGNRAVLNLGTPKSEIQKNLVVEVFAKNMKNVYEFVSAKKKFIVN